MCKIPFAGKVLTLFFIVMLFVSCSRDEPANIDSERRLVEKTIHNSIGWAKNKNINLLYSIIANDSDYTEVHPNAHIVKGFNEFKKAEEFWMNPDFKAIRYEIKNMRINFSKNGNVAWFFCMLDDINEWKGQPANWENTRWTGILEKRDGRWVIVQMHFSFAAE
ncbi:nuclear transport factor 2 family protein [candidate division KSB1 bacterium]|nr:nuclear transport factor 2 family protein [candidate division KSB1 bacterium]